MTDAELRLLIKALAHYVHRGYAIEATEPPLRGKKNGPATEAPRPISFRVIRGRSTPSAGN